MERTVFSEKMAGLTIDEVIRDYEFTMQTKHFHDSFELYFLLEGERYYFIDRETYHVKKGMVVLVNRQQIHKTSLAGKSYHDRILLPISQEGFSPLLEQAGVVPLTRMFEENYGVTELPEKIWEQVKRLLFEIRDELKEKQGKYDGMVKLKLAEILLLIGYIISGEENYRRYRRPDTRRFMRWRITCFTITIRTSHWRSWRNAFLSVSRI